MGMINSLRLFSIYARIILEAKNLVIPLSEYCPEKLEELLRRLYKAFPDKEGLPDEDVFVARFMKWLKLLEVVVDVLWYFFPEAMHQLTWKYIGATEALWRKIFDSLRKYAQENEEVLNKKIAEYSLLYKGKVLEKLLERDFKVQIKPFEIRFEQQVAQEIDNLKKQLSTGPPPEDSDWIVYVDATGVHWRENKEERRLES